MKKKSSVKKTVGLSILAAILVIIAVVGIIVAVNASRNVKAMNQSVDVILDTLRESYTVTEADVGEYSVMKLYGVMKFYVRRYDVEGIGSLAAMTVNMGVMQMSTVVLTPADRDVPLISADYMYMLGSRTCYLEFYDLVLEPDSESYAGLLKTLEAVKAAYGEFEDVTPTSAWYDSLKTVGIYKKGTHKDDKTLNAILADGVGAVADYAKTLPLLESADRAVKAEKQKAYSDGLIQNGGVSTDAFVKSLGKEATKQFFDEVLFRAGR